MDKHYYDWPKIDVERAARALAVKQRGEFSSSIEIQRPENFRRFNDCKAFCESRWKLRALTAGKFSTLFDKLAHHSVRRARADAIFRLRVRPEMARSV